VGIMSEIEQDDIIFSNHRCHGHFIAYGGDPYLLASELMGKATGLVAGRGGSQHIQFKNFYSNGVQGGIVPISVGMALAEKIKKTRRIVLCFIGDGTLGEGVLYESLNMAALWKTPILFILENNRYAQTTPVNVAVSGSIIDRFKAFGIPAWEYETSDVLIIQEAARKIINLVRDNTFPACLILHTYRFSAHSKGDDIRSADELLRIRDFDPLVIQESRETAVDISLAEKYVAERIDEAFNKAEKDPYPVLMTEDHS
jgi:TPP-dependent pyruvate/acetoin dehydrogenase alpha subunit